jgi:aminoglycoside phosphotransferase (APT) family kinase protein
MTVTGAAAGTPAAEHQIDEELVRALHQPAPADAPLNPVRGGPLRERAPFAEGRLHRLAERTSRITPRLWQIWEAALAAPIDVPPTWLHGDLHPRNVLVERGAISAVIDWGDITSGDRATDLAAIWMLFDEPRVRQEALVAYGELSAPTLARARGWALMMLSCAPLLALIAVAAAVLISARVNGPRTAQQLAGVVIDIAFVLGLALVLAALAASAIWAAARLFQRETILTRWT